MEGLAGGARVHAASAVEAEQRPVFRPAAALDVAGDELGDARAVGDEAALAELAAAHDEDAPLGVDVADAEPACLPGAQPEAVAESE